MSPVENSLPPEGATKRRVLAIAYACNPYRGSEHGVGWGWLGMLAQDYQVWCIACKDNQADIKRFCEENADSEYAFVHYTFVEHRWNRRLNKIWPPYYLWQYQRQWQRDAYLKAQELHNAHKIELCHLITYVGYRIPGEFYKLNCPLVWGPIGGLENTPWRLLPAMGLKGAVYYGFRNLINSWHKRFLKTPRHAFKKASESGLIIAATSSIRNEIKKWYGVESIAICEVGPPSANGEIHMNKRGPDDTLRICWSGQHQPGKALPLLLVALRHLPSSIQWRLDVLGDGPCRKKWTKQARRLGLSKRIKWHGFLPRSEAVVIMGSSHIFVITSLKDLTSTVLLEALSLGLPVICPDHCGFSDVVDETCGITIPLTFPSRIQMAFRDALNAIYNNEALRRKLSSGAIEAASAFDWPSKKKVFQAELSKGLFK